MSKIILTLLWMIAFSLYAIGMKIILTLKRKPKNVESYWKDVPEKLPDHLKYQF